MRGLPQGWRAVLGARAAPGARHALDANCYALRLGGTVVMFDAGVGDVAGSSGADRLRAGLRGWPQPAALFLTHGHGDHAGGAAALRAAGAAVHAGARTAEWIAGPDERALSLDAARRAGVYPADYVMHPCPTDRLVTDGETIDMAGVQITVVATPGHSADHQSYLVEQDATRILVGGDALFSGGRVILQDTWDCSVADTCASIRRIVELRPTAILPGHGPVMTGRAVEAALSRAAARVSRLLPPALFL